MNKSLLLGLSALALFGLIGCSGINQEQYRQFQPSLSPDWFEGTLTAHGIVKNRQGEVTRYFNADLTGRWVQLEDGSWQGVLEEQFEFNDGELDERTWVFDTDTQGITMASANDVVEPVQLYTVGNSLFLKYQLLIPYKGSELAVTVDDRMYLVSDTVLLNESDLTKWGFKVGSLQLAIIKKP